MGKKQKTKYRKLSFSEMKLESMPTRTESFITAESKKGNRTIQTNVEEIGCTSGNVVVSDNSRPLGTEELKRNFKTNCVLQKQSSSQSVSREYSRPSRSGSVSATHITHELHTSNSTPGQSGNTNPIQNLCWDPSTKDAVVLQYAIPAQQNSPSADSGTETSEFLIPCISKPLNTNCSQSEGYGTHQGPYLNVDANDFVPRDASDHSDYSFKSDSRPVSHCQKEKIPCSPLENYESNTENRQVSVPSSEKGMELQDDWNNNDYKNYSSRENPSLDHETGDSNKDNQYTKAKKQYLRDDRKHRDSSQSRKSRTRESKHHYDRSVTNQYHNHDPRRASDRDVNSSQNRNNRTRESKDERSRTNQYDSHGPRRDSDRDVTSKSYEKYDDHRGKNRQIEEQLNNDDKRGQQRQDRDFSHKRDRKENRGLKSDSDCQDRTSDSKQSGYQSENTGDTDHSNWNESESVQWSNVDRHHKRKDKEYRGGRTSHPKENLEYSGYTSVVGSQHGRSSYEKKKLVDPRSERERKSSDADSKIHDRSVTDEKGERRNSWKTSTGSQRGQPSYEMKKPVDPRAERERKSLDAESKIHNRSASDDDGSRERRDHWRRSTDSRKSNYFDRSYEKTDEEYRRFEAEYKKNERAEFIKVKEIEKDLFEMPSDYSLGHCVAEDMRMGSGIAVQFKRDFKRVGELLNQRQKQGGLAFLEIDRRFVYYLVTKRASTGKPTYETFWMSLKKLRDHIDENHVKHLAIPRIGCGLDRLEWSKVKFMLEFLFRDVDVEITVCNFQQTEDSTPQKDYLSNKIVDETKSLVEMEEYTMILYYASEDGYVSEKMERLDKKFNFLSEFQKLPKKLGEPIKFLRKNYILYGCVVRKTKEALFDFVAFGNCLSQINKNNRKEIYPYEYVALEEEYDTNDDFLNERIITLLRFHLRDVNIHICPASNVNQKPDEPLH